MWNCANCGKTLPDGAIAHVVKTEHGHSAQVGSDCIKKIKAEGQDGLFSEVSGVYLYSLVGYQEMLAEDGTTK